MTMNNHELTPAQIGALHADLHPGRVATRTQGTSGRALAYLEAYDVKAMLIRVFGYAGFSADCLDAKIIREEQVPQSGQQNQGAARMNWKITAQATVRITIHQTGVTYTETAIAGSAQPDYTESADMALKSAESDALKRAAIYLGTQFGLSLYRDGQTGDIVRRVFAPGQDELTQLTVLARDEANPEVARNAAQRLQRLQASLKVHQPTETPAEPAQQAPEPAPEPEKPKAAPRARKTSTARQKVAEQALADAEVAVGMRNPLADGPADPYAEQKGEARD